MPIMHRGQKITKIMHRGAEITKIYHRGALVYDATAQTVAEKTAKTARKVRKRIANGRDGKEK